MWAPSSLVILMGSRSFGLSEAKQAEGKERPGSEVSPTVTLFKRIQNSTETTSAAVGVTLTVAVMLRVNGVRGQAVALPVRSQRT